MAAVAAYTPNPVIRAVREAVESVVEPSCCARIIERALRRHGLAEVPNEPSQLDGWLRASLAPEVREVAGDDAAHQLTHQLEPIVRRMSDLPSGTRRLTSGRPSRVTRPGAGSFGDSHATPPLHAAVMPPPPDHPIPDLFELTDDGDSMETTQPELPSTFVNEAHDTLRDVPAVPAGASRDAADAGLEARASVGLDTAGLPTVRCRVLVASSDERSVQLLRERFGEALVIEHIDHIGKLMDVAPSVGANDERVALVLDCTRPTMHPASVAGLAEELPYGWWVVAWGIDMMTWEELEPDRQGPIHWVRCAGEAGWNDVIGLSSTLLAAGG